MFSRRWMWPGPGWGSPHRPAGPAPRGPAILPSAQSLLSIMCARQGRGVICHILDQPSLATVPAFTPSIQPSLASISTSFLLFYLPRKDMYISSPIPHIFPPVPFLLLCSPYSKPLFCLASLHPSFLPRPVVQGRARSLAAAWRCWSCSVAARVQSHTLGTTADRSSTLNTFNSTPLPHHV